MIDEQRPGLHVHFGDRRQRHLAAARRRHVDRRQRVDGSIRLRIGLHDDAILIRLREDGGDDPLAECIVQRVVDRPHADAEPRGAVAVDGDVGRKSVVFLIADHVRELGLLAQRRQQLGRPGRQCRVVGALERELVLGAADRVVQCEILNGLHVQRDARDGGGLAAQAADHIGDARGALVARLQVDQEAPAVQSDVVAVDADERREAEDVRILEDGRCQRLLAVRHGGVGDRLAWLRRRLESIPCPDRERIPWG